jgi:CMP-N,N'-diacetyllegionaminic acid synthase
MRRSTFSNLEEDEKVIAIIPARGGSITVPKKNIHPLMEKPLIAWTIDIAIQTPILERVIVSTDDLEIARIARENGAEVPFIRPSEIAQDSTPDIEVYRHLIAWLIEYERVFPDIVVWLRPTSPLRTVEDIEKAVDILISTDADCVRSVCRVEHHPYWMKRLEGSRLLPLIEGKDEHTYYRRQLLPPIYRLNGSVDVIRCKSVERNDMLFSDDMYGYVMPFERSIDLDDQFDFEVAEMLIRRQI